MEVTPFTGSARAVRECKLPHRKKPAYCSPDLEGLSLGPEAAGCREQGKVHREPAPPGSIGGMHGKASKVLPLYTIPNYFQGV